MATDIVTTASSAPQEAAGSSHRAVASVNSSETTDRWNQQAYLHALPLAKRGVLVEYQGRGRQCQATVKITDDGAALAVEWEASKATKEPAKPATVVPLTRIQSVVLRPSSQSAACFSLEVEAVDDHDRGCCDALHGTFRLLEQAEDASRVLIDWILALTCGANAFRQRGRSVVDLAWQGARLRIFELAEVNGLEGAIVAVMETFDRFHSRHSRPLNGEDDTDGSAGKHVAPACRLFLRLAPAT